MGLLPPKTNRPSLQHEPMKQQELIHSVVRFLRRCYVEGDFQTLKKANIHGDLQQRLLNDISYWLPDRRNWKPAVVATVFVDWTPIIDVLRTRPKCAKSTDGHSKSAKRSVRRKSNPYGELAVELLDHARTALRTSDYRLLSELNFTDKELQVLDQLNIDICLGIKRSPIAVSLQIDHKRVAMKDGSLSRQCESTVACLRLIRCGAIFPQVNALTGMSTQEYVYLRSVAGVTNRSRVPNRTEDEEDQIHDLLNKVCGNRPPQMADYLQMCDMTNDDIDLGKVHHEAEIRWSKN